MARRKTVEVAALQEDLRALLATKYRAKATSHTSTTGALMGHRAWLLNRAEQLESGVPFYSSGWQLGLSGNDMNQYVLQPHGQIKHVDLTGGKSPQAPSSDTEPV